MHGLRILVDYQNVSLNSMLTDIKKAPKSFVVIFVVVFPMSFVVRNSSVLAMLVTFHHAHNHIILYIYIYKQKQLFHCRRQEALLTHVSQAGHVEKSRVFSHTGRTLNCDECQDWLQLAASPAVAGHLGCGLPP